MLLILAFIYFAGLFWTAVRSPLGARGADYWWPLRLIGDLLAWVYIKIRMG